MVFEAGKQGDGARLPRKRSRTGLSKHLLVREDEDLIGRYVAEDIVNMDTGEIYAEAGNEIDDANSSTKLNEA